MPALRASDSTEALIEATAAHPSAPSFWMRVEEAITRAAIERLRSHAPGSPTVATVETRLFSMNGAPLGALL